MITPTRGRARIGVFVPFTNTNLEPDMVMIRPDGISLHFARIGGYDEDQIPDEEQMAGLGASNLDDPLALLKGVNPDLIVYGCTSATLAHGPAFDRDLATQIYRESGAKTVTAAGALVHSLRALKVNRIGFASPYVASLNDRAISFLADEGFSTVQRADFDIPLSNDGQGALTPEEVLTLGLKADSPDAEAIVLSCTDMRALEVVDRLEKQLGKPVVTSNQAMMYQALQLLGISQTPSGYGRLFERI